MKNDAPMTAMIQQKMRMLVDIVKYVANYAYEHDMLDLLNYINGKLTEIEEVEE